MKTYKEFFTEAFTPDQTRRYLINTAKNRNLEQVFFNQVVKDRYEYFPASLYALEAKALLWASEVVTDYRILERKLAEVEIKLSK